MGQQTSDRAVLKVSRDSLCLLQLLSQTGPARLWHFLSRARSLVKAALAPRQPPRALTLPLPLPPPARARLEAGLAEDLLAPKVMCQRWPSPFLGVVLPPTPSFWMGKEREESGWKGAEKGMLWPTWLTSCILTFLPFPRKGRGRSHGGGFAGREDHLSWPRRSWPYVKACSFHL